MNGVEVFSVVEGDTVMCMQTIVCDGPIGYLYSFIFSFIGVVYVFSFSLSLHVL